MTVATQNTPSVDSLLTELDQLYTRFRQTEHVATWGGSFEREHGARMALKPIVNKMFDTLLIFLEERKKATSVGRGNKNQAQDQVSQNEII